MTIVTKDLSHRMIIACVFLPLFLFQNLSYVSCQQDSHSSDLYNNTGVAVESVIGIILLAMFLLGLVVCCYCALCKEETEADDHEVVYTRARGGLEKEVIDSFPFFLYSEVKRHKIGKGGVECAICLSEFEDNETLRWMPPCSHTFHANCIDVWLSSRSTCPVCRANLSLKPGERFLYPSIDLETGNAQRVDLESTKETSLTWNNSEDCTTPRSRSTGLLSSWRMAEKFVVSRSHSDGHSLVQLGDNQDRFTLQLPEEMHRELVSLNLIRRNHMALPQARSSRQGYRSGSVGSETSAFSQRQQTLRRAISMSLKHASVRSTLGRDDLIRETSQANDTDFGERSFQRLMPEKV